jgi:hypothetical protein
LIMTIEKAGDSSHLWVSSVRWDARNKTALWEKRSTSLEVHRIEHHIGRAIPRCKSPSDW